MNRQSESGQIGLVVLLIMTTMLTVGIGAISRSTRDLRITRQELEASKAFNAAEAGVETALSDIENGVTFTDGVYSNTTTVDAVDVAYSIEEQRDFQIEVQENQTLFINVESATPYSGEVLDITWARDQDCSTTPASLVVKQYSLTGPVITEAYYKCPRGDGFTEASSGSVGITLRPDEVYVAVRPVYSETIVEAAASGSTWTLPVQAYQINSRATLPETDETRVVVLNKTVEMPPDIFSYALVSGTTILMN